jgi:protein disulfide-isomerase
LAGFTPITVSVFDSQSKELVMQFFVILASVVKARSKPYDESAYAKVVLQTALHAKIDRKPVFFIFGANWCDDCRTLDHAIIGGQEKFEYGQEY